MAEASGLLVQYLETLRRIAIELGPQRSFPSALRFLLRTLAENHHFVRPHLVIFDPTAKALRLCLADTPPREQGAVYEPGVGITGQVFTLGRPVIVERLSDNPLFQNRFFSRTPEDMETLAFLSVPVLGRGDDPSEGVEVLGVLSMDTPVAERTELEERCHFLEVVAGLIGTQVSYLHQEMASREARTAFHGDSTVSLADGLLGSGVVSASKSLRQALAQVMRAGASRGAVLLRGEAGTGKETLARILHKASSRCGMPLVCCNGAALSADTPDKEDKEGRERPDRGGGKAYKNAVEFLGVQKGATPSVVQTRKGILERAHLGTLVLQNLEMLPRDLQRAVLRALQEHEVLRVGASQPVHVDVRIVWATQRSVEELRQGLVDEELLAHFMVWDIPLPPLRERVEDILPLAEHFLLAAAQAQGKKIRRISTTAVDLLSRHAWLGNAHELKSCMERALLACTGDSIRAWHLPPSLQREEEGATESVNFSDTVARFEQELLVDALQKTRGNVLEASRLLNTSYRIIHYKVKKYGLDERKYS